MSGTVYVDLGPVLRAVHDVNSNLSIVNGNIDAVHGAVNDVDQNVRVIYDEVGKLASEFKEFVELQIRANRLNVAHTKIVSIRQELEKKFGHHDAVRRHTTGILQAEDLGFIRSNTITTVTEQLMLDAPGYWLAPCLVAIAAWINNQPEITDKAIREAIKRHDEKTSLLFALICRRADRKDACLKWTQRYLANQDEENLDRKAVIILDAFASGLLGADTEGVVGRQMSEWMDHLSQKPGFVEQQTKQWSEAINSKRRLLDNGVYPYLRKYSDTWPILSNIMEGAYLHATIFKFFEDIFNKETSSNALKVQLDEILTNLVTAFDDEELPLRKQEKLEQYVIEFDGDEKRAQANMAVEQTAFETHKDFTQLLTDAAMRPETSGASVSTQKFAIALSRDWISNAYNDVIAKNRMAVPHEIELSVENFNDKTTDGQNETEVINNFNKLIDKEKAMTLAQIALTLFERFCLWGGCAIVFLGGAMWFLEQACLGWVVVIAGSGMIINHFSKKKKNKAARNNIESKFENRRSMGSQIIRATMAEIVDFRAEFKERDSESHKVTTFLEQISPDQYVRRLSDSSRRIKAAH